MEIFLTQMTIEIILYTSCRSFDQLHKIEQYTAVYMEDRVWQVTDKVKQGYPFFTMVLFELGCQPALNLAGVWF